MEIEAKKIEIKEGGVLTHQATTTEQVYSLILKLSEGLEIATASKIDVSGRGYIRGYTKGNSPTGASGNAGGSYGGLGKGDTTNWVYGDYKNPEYPGSGGSPNWPNSASGGGLVKITAGSLVIDGSILANGGNGVFNGDAAGSGGGILINAGSISGQGVIRADGGNGYINGGSGGGGRIAIYYWNSLTIPRENFTANGGTGGIGSGQNGTVWFNEGETYFTWSKPEDRFLHDNEEVSFSVLGIDPEDIKVRVFLYQRGNTYTLGEIKASEVLTFNTQNYSDGIYQLLASFYDEYSNLLENLTKDIVINNSVFWHSGRITSNQTWTSEKVHVIEGTIIIVSGVTLTIQPGAIVKFVEGARIIVEDGAVLNLLGEIDNAIILTSFKDDTAGGDTNFDGQSSSPAPGDWSGYIVYGTGQVNLNDYLEIRYSSVTHSGTIDSDQTWNGTFVHRITSDVTVASGVTLTIEKGAVIKLEDKKGIIIQAAGKIIAEGTNSQPIIFTSIKDDTVAGDLNGDGNTTEPAAGDWRWIYIEGEAYFEKVYFYYGGGTASGNWDQTGMIRLAGNGILNLSRCILKDAYFDGVLAWGSGLAMANIENSIFTGIDRAVCAHPGSTIIINNSTFDDNRIGVLVHGGNLTVKNSIVSNSIESGIQYDFGTLSEVSYCNVWSNQGQNYRNTQDLTGINGNISSDPKYKDREKYNFNLDYLSPCIDAADSTAVETDFVGSPRYTDPRTIVKNGNSLPNGAYADMGAFEFVETASSNVDLIVDWVSGPQEAVAGRSVIVQWQERNAGTEAATGPWHTQILMVPVLPYRGVTSIIVDEVLTETGLGPGQSIIRSATVKVPGGNEGTYNWQIKINSKGDVFEGINSQNNISPLSNSFNLSLPELTLSTPISGNFDKAEKPVFYKINQNPGQQFVIELDLTQDQGRTRIYLGYNVCPTTTDFDLRSIQTDSPDSRLVIPSPDTNRTNYILLYPETLPGTNVPFNVSASLSEFGLLSLGLTEGSNYGRVTIPFSGSNFNNSLKAFLRNGEDEIQAETVLIADSGNAFATFNLVGIDQGVYDFIIRQQQLESVLLSSFTITGGTGPKLEIRLILPQNVRVGRPFKGSVEVLNTGDSDLPLPLITINGNNNIVFWGSEQTESETTFELQFLPVPTEYLSPPYIIPGGKYTFNFYGKVSTTGYIPVQVVYKPGDSSDIVNWDEIKQVIRGDNPHPLFDITWDVLVQEIGNTYADYISSLYKASQETVSYGIGVNIVGELFTYMFRKEMALLSDSNIQGNLTIEGSNSYERIPILLINTDTEESYYTTTWYNGRFTLRNVPEGNYTVLVNGSQPDSNSSVIVSQGINQIEITITRKAKLSGRIIDSSTQLGIPEATINLFTSSNVFTTETDENGFFILEGIPEGNGSLTIYAEGYISAEKELSFVAGETTSVVTYLTLGGSIKGRVFDYNGAPVSEAIVKAFGTGVGSSYTDSQGNFEIKGLPTGNYIVVSDKQGYGANSISDINVVQPQITEGIILNLVQAGNLTGNITDKNTGQPVSNVVISTSSGDFEESFLSDSNGNFTFNNIRQGLHTFWFVASGYLVEKREISIEAGQTTNINIALNPGGTIEGRVQRETGSGVSGIEVILIQENGDLEITETDSNGNFGFDGLPFGNYILAVNNEGKTLSRTQIAVDQDTGYLNQVINLNFAEVSGKVVLSDGVTPDTFAQVYVIKDGNIIQKSFVDSQGEFKFLFFQEGDFEILSRSPKTNFIKKNFSITTLGNNINLGNSISGDFQLNIDITDITSQPVSFASVLIRPSGIEASDENIETTYFTDENGRCVITGLSSALYTIEIIPPDGFAGWKGEINVSSNPVQLNIQLDSGCSVSGTIKDSSNNPLVAEVRFRNINTGQIFTAFSDTDGNFSINVLPESTYDIYFIKNTYQPYFVSGFSTYKNLPRTINAVLNSSGSEITGVVRDLSGNSLINIEVALVDNSGKKIISATTNFDGEYKLQNVLSGTQKIVVRPSGYEEKEVNITVPESGSLQQDIEVENYLVFPFTNLSGFKKMGKIRLENQFIEQTSSVKFFNAGVIGIPEPTYPFDPTWALKFIHYVPERYCKSWENAWNKCWRSKDDIDRAFDAWKYAWKALSEFTSAEIGLALSQAGKIGASAVLTLSSIAKQGVEIPAKTMAAIYELEKYGGHNVGEQIQQMRDFYDFLGAVLGSATSVISTAREYAITGQWNKLDATLGALGPVFSMVDGALANRFPVLNKFPGILSSLTGLYSTIKDFYTFAKDLSDVVDNTLKDRLSAYDDAQDLFRKAIDKHRENMQACKAAADYCQDGDPPPPPPKPPGGNQGGNGGTTGVGSIDPNTKLTTGIGENGYIANNSLIIYTIFFENKPDANASAQEVVVTDQLSDNFDWTTLELLEIGFNNVVINVPQGLSNYETTTSVSTDPNPVRVKATFNSLTGALELRIWSYDPITGELPEDPFSGFLPPNNEQHQGEGYLTFSIGPKSNLADQTQITNKATIVFDVNPPIETPVVINTIDSSPPTSYISALPPTIKDKNVQLILNGSDNGSGVDFFEIYVSTDSGPYVLYTTTQSNTVDFTGDYNRTYRFYSVAQDLVGNKENPPTTPDATTTLQIPTYTITATAGPGGSISPSGQVIVNEGQDQIFNIAANQGYQIADVLVDGISVGAVTSYTFYNVSSDHTIHATFVATGNPILKIEPQQITFAENETEKTFTIKNIGSGILTWQIGQINYQKGENWISSIIPQNGNTLETTDVFVSVSRQNLTYGTYTANIQIISNGGEGFAQVVMYVANTPPEKPIPISPKTSNNILFSPYLISSPFSDIDQNDTQTASMWEIYLKDQTEDETPILRKLVEARDTLTQIRIEWGTLKPNTEYKWRVKYRDSFGPSWSEWSDFALFTTKEFDPDLAIQIPDYGQIAILQDSVNIETGIKEIIQNTTIGVKSNFGSIKMLKSIDPSTLTNNEGKPSDIPFGLFSIRIEDIPEDHDKIEVYFYLPGNMVNYSWYKYNEIDGWHIYPSQFKYLPEINYTEIKIEVVDGGDGDFDGVKNSIIVDPSGPAPGEEIELISGGGGCFIATACFGNYNHPIVKILREFRDKFLVTNRIGKIFVRWYYSHSPKYAEIISNSPVLKGIVRILLIPFVIFAYLCIKGLILPLILISLSILLFKRKALRKTLLILFFLVSLSSNISAQNINHFKIIPGEKYTVITPTRFLLEKGKVQIDLVYSYADSVLEGVISGATQKIISSQNLIQAGITIGFSDRFNLSVLVPYLIDQNILSGLAFEDSGFGDIYLIGKIKIWDGVVLLPYIGFDTGDERSLISSNSTVYGIKFSFDKYLTDKLIGAFNLGYSYQKKRTIGQVNMDNSFLFGGSLIYIITEKIYLSGEIVGRSDNGFFRNKESTPVEGIVSLGWDLKNCQFVIGAGAGIVDGYGAANWRLFISLKTKF
ncbi:MAG: carboxypeptidase regulatory-like domain-containing protein [Candidatus Omnitrophica bacterium]|nr:carboxypeptidase regulatory-like domain-containing protein [Candidatus Omnitrophota bacterium]